ncbi:protein of unknown function [Candidatus Nitrosocosmicus franklandus]|uniref:Uncharacterized protein n=1 Tax=Candidatus Nitrosocosmicus franklandianus TaxID=1798806 RepID=A0A484IB61_9ARCH|nr:protein of unknown function [Candidatus Nitrosocosmicus franklandus]
MNLFDQYTCTTIAITEQTNIINTYKSINKVMTKPQKLISDLDNKPVYGSITIVENTNE